MRCGDLFFWGFGSKWKNEAKVYCTSYLFFILDIIVSVGDLSCDSTQVGSKVPLHTFTYYFLLQHVTN